MKLTPRLFVALCGFVPILVGCVHTITAKSTASGNGEINSWNLFYPATLTNGDFLVSSIVTNGCSAKLGDGWNDVTVWQFDFNRQQPPVWTNLTEIRSAVLEIHLRPNGEIPCNDLILFGGLCSLSNRLANIHWPLTNEVIKADLCDYCSSDQILKELRRGSPGRIRMLYYDDAFISKAVLTLKGKRANQ